MNRTIRIVSHALAIFLFINTATIGASAASVDLKTGIGFVTASSLRLRSAPSTASGTLAYAPRGDVVVILSKSGQWYKVNYNLQTGYMHADYLSVRSKENAELGYGRITGSSVNVRSTPTTGSSVLAVAKLNDRAYIIGLNETWFKVIFGDHIGYIRSDFVDLTEIPYENARSTKDPLFFVGGKSTGKTPSASALNAPPASTGAQIVATARKYIGVPYLWGGSTPKGFDCSGYTRYVFAAHGISLPRTTDTQWRTGTAVSKANLKEGDLVFFGDTYRAGISHVGIYVGNNQFIHASSSKGVIITSMDNSYWASRYYGARRVL